MKQPESLYDLPSHNPTYTNVGSNFFNTVHLFIGFLIVAWMSNGLFTYIKPYFPGFINWGLFLIWISFAIIKSKLYATRFIKQCWPLLFFLVYLLVLLAFNPAGYIRTYIYSFAYLIVVYSIFLYYTQEKYRSFLKFLVGFILFEQIFIAVNTYIKLQENPLLSRILTAGSETIERNLSVTSLAGVGNYGYFYPLVSIILLLWFMFFNYPRKKVLYIIGIVIFTTVLIKASFTLALMFTFIFSLIIILKKITKHSTIATTFMFLILLFLYSQGVISSFLLKLSSMPIFSNEISVRFIELSSFLSGGSVSGTDLQSRLEAYYMSFEAFIHNIITGTSMFPNTIYLSGEHSAWLDLLAHFGLTSVFVFVFFFKAYRHSKAIASEKFRSIVKIYWIYFLLLGLVNTLFFAPIYTVWLLFLPAVIQLLSTKELNKN